MRKARETDADDRSYEKHRKGSGGLITPTSNLIKEI